MATITSEKVIQLAIDGNSPLPVLNDLANDKIFKGKLVIDVTEGLFLVPLLTIHPSQKPIWIILKTARRPNFSVLRSIMCWNHNLYFLINIIFH